MRSIMSVVNLEEPSFVGAEPNQARSQLATNSFLINLGRVFNGWAFTSRIVSHEFGLDFLETSKRLSRMSRRPYYLLSVVRVPRGYGGYENVYTISPRGWRRIGYLQGQSGPVRVEPVLVEQPAFIKEQSGLVLLQAAQHLVNGKGKVTDLMDNVCCRALDRKLPPVSSPLDETGLLLVSFDPQFLPSELFNSAPSCPPMLRTMNRVSCLRSIGLVPADLDIPSFVLNARVWGSSESAVLLSVVLRGARELRDTLKSKSVSKLDCKDCSRYKLQLKVVNCLLEAEKDIIGALMGKVKSLREKLAFAS